MNSNYRRPVSRNYSGRNDGSDEIDAALDDLGNFSYLDGIPFELDRGIQSALETARIHMNKAEALLAQPLPSSLNNSTRDNSLLEDIGRVERQVLDQLKQIEQEREERKRKKDAMIKEYLDKKEKEKREAEKLEEEQKLKSLSEKDAGAQDNETGEETNENLTNDEDALVDEHEKTNSSIDNHTETTPEDNLGQELTSNSINATPEAVTALSKQTEDLPSTNPSQNNESNQKESNSSIPTSTAYLEPFRNSALQSNQGNPSKSHPAHGLINFSEFENESDPFEKAELQTLNDMQELASVFPQSNTNYTNAPADATSTSITNPSVEHQPYSQSKSSMMVSTAGNNLQATNQATLNAFQYAQYSQQLPRLSQANHVGQFNPYIQTSQGVNVPGNMMPTSSTRQHYPPSNIFHQEIARPYIPPYHTPISNNKTNHVNESDTQQVETLKTSKSVGDLMTEIQKETETMMLETDKDKKRNTNESSLKKSRAFSQTPPPSKSNCKENESKITTNPLPKVSQGRQTALDDWIPWPDIDGLPSSSQQKPSSQSSQPRIDPLEGLSNESIEKCKQLHDMGFPLERLGKACRAIGDDEQKLINYCLFVDKILEDSTVSNKTLGPNPSVVVEDVVLIHPSDETKIKKHLEAFGRLTEFGFEPPSKIHTALTECDLNYEKALEQMLK